MEEGVKKMIRGHKTNVVALFSFFLLFAAYEPLRAFTEALGSPSSVHSPKREDVDLGTPKQPPEESAAAAAAAAASRDSGSESGAADSAASLRSSAGGPSSSSGDSRLPGPSGSSNSKANLNGTPAPRERGAGDVVCSTGLRLAFDCALRRIVAFGVRDYLLDKYKLPMVPLDLCQSDILLDVEQCIPTEFADIFPADAFLEVVRQKQLLVGTMDFSVFPQLASDQGYTSGFYPELVQAVARELTVIALQNPGLRRELVGDRELNISILDQSFSKRLHDVKTAVAQELSCSSACNENGRKSPHHGLQQLSASSRKPPVAFMNDSLGVDGDFPWQDGLPCGGEASAAGSASCLLMGCLSPWRDIPKDVLIGVTHVKFSTPMNLVAAVHRGEVHMTDVGTIASAYLPEKYNFLPLREVLEPSCTIGAWKSFFLLRDPWSRRRRDRKHHSGSDTEHKKKAKSHAGAHSDARTASSSFSTGGLERNSSSGLARSSPTADTSIERRHSLAAMGEYPRMESRGDELQSWEDRMGQTRSLFFKLYGVQTDGSPTASTSSSNNSSSSKSSQQQPATPGTNAVPASRSAETDTAAYEERTLVKLQAVDHFLFSYLFPEDLRVSSVRKLTDLSSVLSDGEPVGAFGYGLAGRGGRRRISSGLSWRCHSQQRRSPSWIGARLRRESLLSRMGRACDVHQTAAGRHGVGRQHDGVVEFPGPLVPLAAFFSKSRDPMCRGISKRAVMAVAEKQTALSAAASMPMPFSLGRWCLLPAVCAWISIFFALF